MKKKIFAAIISIILCFSLSASAFALDLGGIFGGSSDDTSSGDSDSSNILNDILSSEIFQEIIASEGVVDITNLVMEIMMKYNPDSIKEMGKEQASLFIQSTINTIADAIMQVADNKDLIIKYDPLEVLGNFFDLELDEVTSEKPEEDTTKDPDELEIGMGDVDGDGKITAADARLILRRAAKLITLSMEQEARADVDKDGKITAADARKVLRVSAGLETFD